MRPAARLRLVLVAGLLAGACGVGPDVAATVNGRDIPAETVRSLLEGDRTMRGSDFEAMSLEERYAELGGSQSEILTALILREILGDIAQELGVALNEQERQQAIEQYVERLGGQERVNQLIEVSGLGEEQFYDRIGVLSALEQRVLGALAPDSDPSDEQLREQYESNPELYEVREVSQIVVQTPEEAEQIIDEVRGGADFADLVAERSLDTATAAAGGSIGEVSRANLAGRPDIAEAVFSAEPGEVIGPFDLGDAALVLRVGRQRTIPFADALDALREQARQEQGPEAQERLASLAAQADVDVNSRFGRWDPAAQRVVDDPVAPTAIPAAPAGGSG